MKYAGRRRQNDFNVQGYSRRRVEFLRQKLGEAAAVARTAVLIRRITS
jgi:hypothetical protein